MPRARTVQIRIHRDQARVAADWLLNELPRSHLSTGRDSRSGFPFNMRPAERLGKQLAKAAQRERRDPTFTLSVDREMAEWFGAQFGSLLPGVPPVGATDIDGRLYHAFPCPPEVTEVASIFLRAVTRGRGRRFKRESAQAAARRLRAKRERLRLEVPTAEPESDAERALRKRIENARMLPQKKALELKLKQFKRDREPESQRSRRKHAPALAELGRRLRKRNKTVKRLEESRRLAEEAAELVARKQGLIPDSD